MKFYTAVLKDTITNQTYKLFLTRGILTLHPFSTSIYQNPILKDCKSKIYWQISLTNGIITYTPVSSSGVGDTVYLLDIVTQKYYFLLITNGARHFKSTTFSPNSLCVIHIFTDEAIKMKCSIKQPLNVEIIVDFPLKIDITSNALLKVQTNSTKHLSGTVQVQANIGYS